MAWIRSCNAVVTAARVMMAATVAMVLTQGGCERRSSSSVPPDPAAAAPVSRAMLGNGIDISGQDAFDRLFESPEVSEAGQRLLERLSSDPTLEPLYAEFIQTLMQQPALLQALMSLADQDPEASVESLSAQVGERLGEAIDGPEFDAALDASLDRLLDRPDVDAAFGRMTDALIDRGFTDSLVELIGQWQPDIEDAVGMAMGEEEFEARFEAHLSDPQRSTALEELLAERVAGDLEFRAGLAALLDDEEVFVACSVLVVDILSSEAFAAGATDVFAGMIVGVDAEELGRRVDGTLVTPEIEQALVDWVERVTAAPSFEPLALRLGRLLDDPNVRAELYEVIVGAPQGSAA